MKTNDQLYEEALEAAKRLFGDTSVDIVTTAEQLDALIEELSIWRSTIPV